MVLGLKWPPEKNSQLIERLISVVGSLHATDSASAALELLEEAKHLNAARNDFAHSFIVAHGPEGQLFVQRVRVTNNRSKLELQEGTAWSISHIKEVTHALAIWCEKFAHLVAGEARKKGLE